MAALTPLPNAPRQLGVDMAAAVVEDAGHALLGMVGAEAALQSDAVGSALSPEELSDGVIISVRVRVRVGFGAFLGHRCHEQRRRRCLAADAPIRRRDNKGIDRRRAQEDEVDAHRCCCGGCHQVMTASILERYTHGRHNLCWFW